MTPGVSIMGVSKSDAIIIVGGGAFGLSTALHLSQRGYSNISVFEKDDNIPPRFSAANDLNKIVRAEYEDPFYTDLTIVCENLETNHMKIQVLEDQCTNMHCFRKPFPPGRLPCSLLISTKPASCTVYPELPQTRPSTHYTDSEPPPRRTPKSSPMSCL